MLAILLDPASEKAMYIQIYEYIKEEILSGRLAYHEKLPSARSLAAFLQVSRATVDTAYEQLVAEGYVEPKPKRGYFVNSLEEFTWKPTPKNNLRNTLSGSHQKDHPAQKNDSPFEHSKTKTDERSPRPYTTPHWLYDFNPDAIDTAHFPYSIWKSLGKNELDQSDNFLMGENLGEPSLRSAIADYLHGSRGVLCSPDNIVVGAGLSHLLQMLCVLFDEKPSIAMEDPGYISARKLLTAGGCRIIDIPLKGGSLDAASLEDTDAKICYVTPTHQFPLGAVMPINRRQKLLQWASKEKGRYIIEDDHDSEFRYTGRPIPALQSIDKENRVIYIGTFSRAVSPALRTGYMVLPPALMEKYREKCGSIACPVPRWDQNILARFITEGYFEKHLNRMRKIYKNKHDFMVEQIRRYFPEDQFRISGDNAGLYVLLHYTGPIPEEEIEKRAEKNGIRLRSLKGYYASLSADYHPTCLLGFADLSEADMEKGLALLAHEVFLLPEPCPSESGLSAH